MLGRKPVTQSRIIDVLKEHHLLSAPQILEKMSEKGQSVNKTSVYRALEKLMQSGSLCKHTFANDSLLYELRDHHHDHLVCENCGKIEVIECNNTIDLPNSEFKVSHHHLTLFGTCVDCQKKNNS